MNLYMTMKCDISHDVQVNLARAFMWNGLDDRHWCMNRLHFAKRLAECVLVTDAINAWVVDANMLIPI